MYIRTWFIILTTVHVHCTYMYIHTSNLQEEEEEEEEEEFEHRASKRPRSDFIQDEAGDCYLTCKCTCA